MSLHLSVFSPLVSFHLGRPASALRRAVNSACQDNTLRMLRCFPCASWRYSSYPAMCHCRVNEPFWSPSFVSLMAWRCVLRHLAQFRLTSEEARRRRSISSHHRSSSERDLCLHSPKVRSSYRPRAPNSTQPSQTKHVSANASIIAHNQPLTKPILVFLTLLNRIFPFPFVPLTQKLMSILPCI